MFGWGLVVELLVILGSTGALGIVIKGAFDRKKVRVENEASQVAMALSLSSQAVTDINVLKEDMRKVRSTIRAHEVWDRKVIRELERANIEIDPPPELFFV